MTQTATTDERSAATDERSVATDAVANVPQMVGASVIVWCRSFGHSCLRRVSIIRTVGLLISPVYRSLDFSNFRSDGS